MTRNYLNGVEHLLLFILLFLTACGGTLEIGVEGTATPGDLHPTVVAATATPDQGPALTSTSTPESAGWSTYSNPSFAVLLQYPAHWQPADDRNYVGEDGFFSIGAIGNPELNIADIAADEAGHVLQPYGSRPIIEELKIQDQPARLILPSADAGMGDQAALIVRYPEPVELGDTYQFFTLYADQGHIRAIAQTLQFTVAPPIIWQNRPLGLVYAAYDGLWWIDADEQAVHIHDNAQAVLSPDGKQLLSYDNLQQDGWLLDLAGSGIFNLTHTPERLECCLQWWPARPDVVIFHSTDKNAEGAPGLVGYLSAINTDGNEYRILDPEHDAGPGQPALSPDGQTIAYGGGSTGWLYRWDAGPEAFDPIDYGLTGYGDVEIGCPAWSPDGTRLAWIVRGSEPPGGSSQEGDLWSGIGLFDLAARTVSVLHIYEPQGAGWPPAPTWSPDGNWMTLGDGSLSDDAGLWVARTDGQGEEHRLGYGGNPVWSPDGKWLAFGGSLEDGSPAYLLAKVGTWELQPLDIPPDRYGKLVDWISLPTQAGTTPPAGPDALDASSWPVYANGERGIRLSYPPNLVYTENDNDAGSLWDWSVIFVDERYQENPSPQAPGIWIHAYPNPEGISPDHWLIRHSTTAPFGAETVIESPIYHLWPVQELPAFGYEGRYFVRDVMGLRIPTVLLPHAGWMLEIAYGDFGPDDLEPVFAAMLGTLTLEP